MREWIMLLAVGMSALGCNAAAVSDGAGDDSAIQGGHADAKDEAVGLVWFEGGGFCTGTLIAPDLVLTAGHCVEHKVEGFYLGSGPAGQASVGAGAPPNMERHAVADQAAYPGFAGVWSCPASTFDLGLLKLSKAITKVTPRHVAKSAPAVGTVCSAVGYGEHSDGAQTTYEQKRRATETVTSSNDVAIAVTFKTGIIDRGDSGGPLLCAGGAIAGVTSCKVDGDWPSHKDGVYGRVDTAARWIQQMSTSWQGAGQPDACAHSTCQKGAKLPATCNECVAAICALDAYCCTSTWDQGCVAASATVCGVSCH